MGLPENISRLVPPKWLDNIFTFFNFPFSWRLPNTFRTTFSKVRGGPVMRIALLKNQPVCCQCETPDVAGEEHLGFIDTEPENESPHKLEVRVFNWPDPLLHAREACAYICYVCSLLTRQYSDSHQIFTETSWRWGRILGSWNLQNWKRPRITSNATRKNME